MRVHERRRRLVRDRRSTAQAAETIVVGRSALGDRAGGLGPRAGARRGPTVVVAPRIELAGLVARRARARRWPTRSLELLPARRASAPSGASRSTTPCRSPGARAAEPTAASTSAPSPAVAGAVLHAALAGFAPHAEERSRAARRPRSRSSSRSPRESAGLVRGVVLDPAGARVEGARVSAGEEIARDRRARGVRAHDPSARATAAAAARGAEARFHCPRSTSPSGMQRGAPLWPEDVVLQLGGPRSRHHRSRGRRGRRAGRRREGVARRSRRPSAGAPDARHRGRSAARAATSASGASSSPTPTARSRSAACWRAAYRLQAVDPRTLASVESAPVLPQHSPVELCLPTRDVHERVAGRVVTASGQPIPGVRGAACSASPTSSSTKAAPTTTRRRASR